jgi:hypothetical protein
MGGLGKHQDQRQPASQGARGICHPLIVSELE